MASNRKLQGEIDRCLKSIEEHLKEFDQIWQKVHSAPTPNLKEKYEGDLKKEIKKLQRFRDQIKSWATNNDIKNKRPLLDARKSIETEMERFKVLEKETKTKAYSKEGLNKRAGRNRSGSDGSDRMDPREDPAKRDTFAWLDEVEEKLQEQLSEMDEKMEGIKATSKKKKTSAAQNESIIDDLQAKLNRHQHHIDQIQLIKDRLEHDELAIALVEEIHDGLDYFVTSHAEVDFQEDEALYEALELDKEIERDESGGEEEETADDGTTPDDTTEATEEEDTKSNKSSSTSSSKSSTPSSSATASSASSSSVASKSSIPATAKPAVASSSQVASKPLTTTPATAATAAPPKGRTTATTPSVSTTGPTPVSVPASTPTTAKGGDTLANIIAKTQKSSSVTTPTAATSTTNAQPASTTAATVAAAPKVAAPIATSATTTATSKAVPTPAASPVTAAIPAAAAAAGPTVVVPKPTGGLPTIAPSQLGRLPPGGVKSSSMMPPPGLGSQTPPPPGLGANPPTQPATGSAAELSGLPSTSLLGSGASASNFPTKDRSLVPDDYMSTLAALEPSLRHLPDTVDTERVKQYIPRNPYRTPSYFPSVPAPIFDDPLLFDKLTVDTLFFIFYFQQGTPHQYLAARELKKQSWRYHKNFLTWFQRHDDPKVTTEEYEQGTYVYFDYESGWCQRIKSDFTFEYRHLEDELQVANSAAL